jgi:nucleoside 2-deoxyribosyltransferase
MKKMRNSIYVSGPITNTANHVKEFKTAVEYLKDQGGKPLDPLQIKPSHKVLSESEEWNYYMKEAIKMLMEADSIYMLDGWEGSRGARIEHLLAQELNIPVYYASEDHKYV